jgi:type I restriction enzyme S subunit
MHEGSGSVVSHIRVPDCRKFEISVPSLIEQKYIARILGALDDKIELNRQTNETLEAMAQALFKSWFVDFDPVIDNALAAGNEIPEPLQARAAARQALGEARKQLPEEIRREFPDGFEFRDEMGWVPRGWEAWELKDLSIKLSKGTTPTKESVAAASDEAIVPFLKVRDLNERGEIDSSALSCVPRSVHVGALKRSALVAGDVLFSIAGTIGRVAMVPVTLGETNINQALAFVRASDPRYSRYLYHHLRSEPVQSAVRSRVVHAVQANFSLTELGRIQVIKPADESVDHWFSISMEFSLRQDLLRSEGKNLVRIRDTLLPKLLSGELTIPDAEKLVADVL